MYRTVYNKINTCCSDYEVNTAIINEFRKNRKTTIKVVILNINICYDISLIYK